MVGVGPIALAQRRTAAGLTRAVTAYPEDWELYGYDGVLALEIDSLHPDYAGNEDQVVADSVAELRRIVGDM